MFTSKSENQETALSRRFGKIKALCRNAGEILSGTSGLEAFEIAIGVGIAIVLGAIVLSSNKDLFKNTIWPKVTAGAEGLFA